MGKQNDALVITDTDSLDHEISLITKEFFKFKSKKRKRVFSQLHNTREEEQKKILLMFAQILADRLEGWKIDYWKTNAQILSSRLIDILKYFKNHLKQQSSGRSCTYKISA